MMFSMLCIAGELEEDEEEAQLIFNNINTGENTQPVPPGFQQ